MSEARGRTFRDGATITVGGTVSVYCGECRKWHAEDYVCDRRLARARITEKKKMGELRGIEHLREIQKVVAAYIISRPGSTTPRITEEARTLYPGYSYGRIHQAVLNFVGMLHREGFVYRVSDEWAVTYYPTPLLESSADPELLPLQKAVLVDLESRNGVPATAQEVSSTLRLSGCTASPAQVSTAIHLMDPDAKRILRFGREGRTAQRYYVVKEGARCRGRPCSTSAPYRTP